MFHVKHPSPEIIALEVRAKIERFTTGFPVALGADFIARIESFAAMLALWGDRFNLTAHPDDPDEIAFHVIDSLMPLGLVCEDGSPLANAFAADAAILDLGSGAGFPGLVLAAASAGRFRLVESRRKRVSFLEACAQRMGLANVSIYPAHAASDDFGAAFDTVVARAFGPVSEFHRIAARALCAGGRAILYANPEQPLSVEETELAGLGRHERIPYEVGRRRSKVGRIVALWRKI